MPENRTFVLPDISGKLAGNIAENWRETRQILVLSDFTAGKV